MSALPRTVTGAAGIRGPLVFVEHVRRVALGEQVEIGLDGSRAGRPRSSTLASDSRCCSCSRKGWDSSRGRRGSTSRAMWPGRWWGAISSAGS